MKPPTKRHKLRVSPRDLNAVYLPHLLNYRRYQIYFGGAASGKSVFLASRTVLDVLCGRNYLVLRAVGKTLRNSCWNEITKAIVRMGLTEYFTVSKSEMSITATNNGCQILFAGLDDVEKIKSITPAEGTLTDIWIEEATETRLEDFKQLDKRLRGESRHPKRVTLSFNPIYKTHWIYRQFFDGWDEQGRYFDNGRLSILKTTHRDNRFLSPEDHEALENETDAYYYNVYTLGNWGVLGDVVFTNWRTEMLAGRVFGTAYNGLDFGYRDPFAMVRACVDEAGTLYVLDERGGRGFSNEGIAREILPVVGREYINCDSAEPGSIQELRRYGVNALPARKGPDSVRQGIRWLLAREIVIDPCCRNLIGEMTRCEWRKDKDGNSLEEPEDRDNHWIDALRYAMEPLSMARVATVFSKAESGLY